MISVIIPTYNNKSTIRRAIDSVVHQTYTDWELIVVNDASTDTTKAILKNYQYHLGEDKIKIITNPKNIGPGLSRRKAIHEANGEFVTFLDSDDELKLDFMQTMLFLQQQHDSDLVYGAVEVIPPEDMKNAKSIKQDIGDFITEGSGKLQTEINQQLMKFVTGKLFRKSLFDHFEFSERRIGEDVETMFYACFYANKVRTTSYHGYLHHFRRGSLLANKGLFYKYANSADLNQVIVDFLSDKGDEYKPIIKYIIEFTYAGYLGALEQLKTYANITKADVEESWNVWLKVKKWFEEHNDLLMQCNIIA